MMRALLGHLFGFGPIWSPCTAPCLATVWITGTQSGWCTELTFARLGRLGKSCRSRHTRRQERQGYVWSFRGDESERKDRARARAQALRDLRLPVPAPKSPLNLAFLESWRLAFVPVATTLPGQEIA